MANPLNNEQQIYRRIKEEKIEVDPTLWDVMYHYLGDYVSSINLLAADSIETNQPIPSEDAKKMLDYAMKASRIVTKLTRPQKIQDDDEANLIKIRDKKITLHRDIQELFDHYIPNDLNIITMCVGYHLEDSNLIPLNDVQNILSCTKNIIHFLDKLRIATGQQRVIHD